MNQIELPDGHIIYRTPGWISSLRVSHRGDQVAYIEHPVRHDDSGSVKLVDRLETIARSLRAGATRVGLPGTR
jgi:hypothetical protein